MRGVIVAPNEQALLLIDEANSMMEKNGACSDIDPNSFLWVYCFSELHLLHYLLFYILVGIFLE